MTNTNPVVHFEMPYEDPARVGKFYTEAFGWQMQQLSGEMGNYVMAHTAETDANNMITKPGRINGGFFAKSADAPQHPSVVIAVENIQEAMGKVATAGGAVVGQPMDVPGIGQYVSFTDTEGNRVGMLQPSSPM
jgi:uncharacterized protein